MGKLPFVNIMLWKTGVILNVVLQGADPPAHILNDGFDYMRIMYFGEMQG